MTKIKLLAFTKIELLVVIVIVTILAVFLFPAIRGTQLTEETQADLKNVYQLLFDMDFDKAVQAAEAIRQSAGRELAYYQIVYRLAEAERFDEAQKYVSKIGSAFHRTHQPPISMVIQSRLAETLAAAGRFDEAEQALKKGIYGTEIAAVVSLFLLNANRYDDVARLLDEYDIASEFRRFVAAKFAKNGNYQKAIDIAKAIPLDGWRNVAYREIIREQLKKDQYQDAIQTFSHIEILRYKQQAVAIFVVYLLEKGQSDEAKKLAERFKSPDQANIPNSETNNDPFATTPDEWNKHANDENYDKRPFAPDQWQKVTENIFASFEQPDQPDTKTTSHSKPDDSISDERLKTFLTTLESISDDDSGSGSEYERELQLHQENELFYKVIKKLVELNRTEEALPLVERLRKHYRLLVSKEYYYPFWYKKVSATPFVLYRSFSFSFSEDWNEKLYYLWDAQISVGQLDEALLTMQKLHVTDPKGSSEARRVIAEALFKAERIDEAKEQASLALKFAERAGNYNLDLVSTLFKIGQVDEAKLVLSKIEIPSTLDYDDSASWFKSPVDVKNERQKIDHWREILEKK
jgi:tetratricopeptide (TPR) repeat protein